MKLVERLVVEKQFYDIDDDCKFKEVTVCIAASKMLFETDDLLAVGSYLNETLNLEYDCNSLLKARGVLDDEGTCTVYSRRLSDGYRLYETEDVYHFVKEYLIEK